MNMYHGIARVDVDRVCGEVGFNVVKSYYSSDMSLIWDSMEGFLKWFWATTHGGFDVQVVTQERIQRVGTPPFDFSGDYICIRMIAVKL